MIFSWYPEPKFVSTKTINSITVASPGVVTISAGHNYLEGQQVTISSVTGFEIDSVVQSAAKVFTVKNPTATTFELYDTDGTSSTNVTAYTSGGSVAHGVVVVSNVKGTFNAGEIKPLLISLLAKALVISLSWGIV